MTIWPAGSKATTTHTDAGSDKPRLARVDINQNILNTNDVIDMFNISSPTNGEILVYNSSTSNFKTSDNNSALIKLNKNYLETVNNIASTSGDITVDASLASVHTVNQSGNAVYTFSNLQTGGSVTLIIKISNSNLTASFTTDGSTRVKFAGGAPLLTVSINKIDLVTVFYDGTDYIGSITQRIA